MTRTMVAMIGFTDDAWAGPQMEESVSPLGMPPPQYWSDLAQAPTSSLS